MNNSVHDVPSPILRADLAKKNYHFLHWKLIQHQHVINWE